MVYLSVTKNIKNSSFSIFSNTMTFLTFSPTSSHKHMNCTIFYVSRSLNNQTILHMPLLYPLWVQIYLETRIWWKEVFFLGYFKRDLFINHMTKIIRDIFNMISNTRIDRVLKYIILNSLGGDYPSFTQKSRYFAKWTFEYTPLTS